MITDWIITMQEVEMLSDLVKDLLEAKPLQKRKRLSVRWNGSVLTEALRW